MPLAVGRDGPRKLESAQAPGGQHGSVDSALGDDLVTLSGKDGKNVGSSLGVDGQSLWVRVVDRVAFLVVAGVLLDAGSSVETSHGLSDVHEGLVVAATGEAGGGDVDAFLGEVLDE